MFGFRPEGRRRGSHAEGLSRSLVGIGLLQAGALLLALGAVPSSAAVGLVVGLVVVLAAGLALVALTLRQTKRREDDVVATAREVIEETEQLAPLAAWFLDPATNAMWWSEGMYTLFGRPGKAGPGTTAECLRAVFPDDRRRLLAAFRRVVRTTQPADLCLHARRMSGEECIVRLRMRAVCDRDGRLVCLVGVCLDLTEPLRQVAGEVDHLSENEGLRCTKETLFASLSHEIRTPLNGILGFTEILLEEVTGEHQEFLRSIQRNGYRLLETLTSILELARIERRAMPMAMRHVELARSVRASVESLRHHAEEKGLFVRTEERKRFVLVQVDPGHLERVLVHVIGNAIKFTRSGGIVLVIDAEGDRAVIRVHDTGIGIDAAFVPHVFEAFRQESVGLDRIHEGTGVGLTIAKELTSLMGGSICLESEKGKGSTCTIMLPRVVPANEKDEPALPASDTRVRASENLILCMQEPAPASRAAGLTAAGSCGDGGVGPERTVGA